MIMTSIKPIRIILYWNRPAYRQFGLIGLQIAVTNQSFNSEVKHRCAHRITEVLLFTALIKAEAIIAIGYKTVAAVLLYISLVDQSLW